MLGSCRLIFGRSHFAFYAELVSYFVLSYLLLLAIQISVWTQIFYEVENWIVLVKEFDCSLILIKTT